MVELTGGSSNLAALMKQLAAELPALLRRRPRRVKRRKPRQVHLRLSAKESRLLVAGYKGGSSMVELAKRLDIHRTTVAEILRREGVEIRQRGIPMDQLDEAIRLYRDGWSCRRLAEHYECDDETVRQVLMRAGVKMRKPWER